MSPASHMVGRLQNLYGVIWNRMRLINERSMRPPTGRWETAPRCTVEPLEPRLLLSTVVWTGEGGDHLWSTGENWSNGVGPWTGDNVVIPMGPNAGVQFTSTVSSAHATINSLTSNETLTVSGGTLTVSGGTSEDPPFFTVNNTLTLSGGTLAVAQAIQVNYNTFTITGGTLASATVLQGDGGTEIMTVAGNVNLDGVTVKEEMHVTSGTLNAVGGHASAISGIMTFSGSSISTTGAGTSLDLATVASISNANITAQTGGSITFDALASLSNVNLTASDGGQILLPAATSYTGYNYGNTTLQASGAGSKIDLSNLATLVGGGEYHDSWGWNYYTTYVRALSGGEVDLAGAISHRNDWTVDGAGSVLGVAEITSLDGAALTVSTPGTLSFTLMTAMTNSTLTAQAGVTLSFPVDTSLANVNMYASGGGQILFPAATSYTGYNYGNTTLQASGAGSKIDLSNLATLVGGGEYHDSWGWNYYTTYVRALSGGEVDLAGAISHRNDWTLDGAGSTMNVQGVTSLADMIVTIGSGNVITFYSATSISNVNLTAAGGGQILFPVATSYTGCNYGNTTLQASGAGSRIDLSHLSTFVGGGEYQDSWGWNYYTTYVKALSGGEVDLAGAISHRNDWTLDGTGSLLGVAGITSLDGTALTVSTPGTWTFISMTAMSNATLTAQAGVTLSFPVDDSLTNVNMYASGGGQILFPAATSYTGYNYGNTTLQASGAGSKIGLSNLATFVGGGEYHDSWGWNYYTTYVKALSGGEVDLAGAISHRNDFTVDGAGSVLAVAGITSISSTSITVVNGATWTLPVGWQPAWGGGCTLTISGAGSRVINNHGTICLSGLNISGGTLDLGDGNLVVAYSGASPLATIEGWLKTGGGTQADGEHFAWNGASGITTSAIAGDENKFKSLGIRDNGYHLTNRDAMTEVDGVPVPANAVVVKYTWMGDMDMDGAVTVNDYLEYLGYYAAWPPAANISWMTGDFNYDGKINVNDYLMLLAGYAAQTGPLGSDEPVTEVNSSEAPAATEEPAATQPAAPAPAAPAGTLLDLLRQAGGTLALAGDAGGSDLSDASAGAAEADLAVRPATDGAADSAAVMTIR